MAIDEKCVEAGKTSSLLANSRFFGGHFLSNLLHVSSSCQTRRRLNPVGKSLLLSAER